MSERQLAGTPPTSLVAFLLERLAEDEAAAADALSNMAGTRQAGGEAADPQVVGQTPTRVLRDVAAKRAIVQMWLTGLRTRLVEHRTDGLELVDAAIVELAGVYADHPDFHPSWSADGRAARERSRRSGSGGRPAGDDSRVNVVDLRSGRSGHRPG